MFASAIHKTRIGKYTDAFNRRLGMQRTRFSRLSIQNLLGSLSLDQVQPSPHVMIIVQLRQPRSFMLGFEHDPLPFYCV